jgi:ribosomal protein S18 acetylase RimI-like enzyme
VRFKSGRHVNTWLLDRAAGEGQSVGAAAPIDPEVGVLALDDRQGRLKGVLYNYALHVNAHFGDRYSADYPGVVARRLRERFGAQVCPLFLPGAFADLNPVMSCEQTGNALADVIIRGLEGRAPLDEPMSLGASARRVTVPYRDLNAPDIEERLQASRWAPQDQEYFRKSLAEFRAEGRTETETLVQAWHIGETSFAGIPGEPFVELGMKIKALGPFPWTFPVGLCGGGLGYLVTADAWRGGGYEGLVAKTAPVSPEGVERIVECALAQLAGLRKAAVLARELPSRVTLRNGAAVTIRPLGTGDGEGLAAFYAVVPGEDIRFYCPHPLTRENALAKAAQAGDPNFVCLVVEPAGGGIAGYAWYRWAAGSPTSGFGLCIRRDHQGIGVGAQLTEALLRVARSYGPAVMSLTVQKANPRAVHLYQRMGFRPVRDQVRADGEQEYYMEMRVRER